MIELAPNTALMIYLGLTCCLVLGIWVYHHFVYQQRPRFRPQHELHICEFCQSVYMTSLNKEITKCPQCQTLNRDNRFQR